MINIFTSFYQDKSAVRQAEINECLIQNLMNPYIDRVFILSEEDFEIKDSTKHQVIKVNGRETFSDYFGYINKFSGPDDINIICNSDIFFDDTVLKANYINKDESFALSRWDNGKLYNNKDSQDAWIFKGHIKHIYGDFYLGIPGCDNRIAHEIHKAGYKITNPSLSIKANHLHKSGVRNYTRTTKNTVSPPYKFLVPEKLQAKKILHIALGDDQHALQKALAGMGEYKRINWQTYKKGYEKLNYDIIEASKSFNPDLVFMQIQTEAVIWPETIKELPGKVINWTGDVRQPIPTWYLNTGKVVDLTCFSNEYDVKQFEEIGIPAKFLNIGFDQTIFKPEGPAFSKYDIVFMGNHYRARFPLSKLRYEMVNALKEEFKGKFTVFGKGWDFPTISLSQSQEREAAVYRASKIAINCSHFNLERYTSDRMFRLMGSGAFCLSHNYKGIEKDFIPGRDLIVWENISELINLIKKYLPKTEERKRIAFNGCKKVHELHTWDRRIEELKTLL